MGGVALYGAYAADVSLDSFALKYAMFKLFYNTIAACQRPVGPLLSNKCMYVYAAVDCSTTWDGSEFQSPTVRTAKEWWNACVEEPTGRNLN